MKIDKEAVWVVIFFIILLSFTLQGITWFVKEANNYFEIKLKGTAKEIGRKFQKQGNDFLAEKNSRLKGCLAEIKEIAEPFCNACQEFEPEKKGSNCMYCNYGIILRKISEVEK